MEDDASGSLDGKTLGNLRVVDLKQELDKRGLSKSGTKKDLVKRLKQQLEFEKFYEDRKSTADSDTKLELDAVTEQNEFVQQYLAQQQKIYAEQKEVRRLIELEESHKSSDERESCDSSQNDDNSDVVRQPVDIETDEVSNCDSLQNNDNNAEAVREVVKNKPDVYNSDSSQHHDDDNSEIVKEAVETVSDEINFKGQRSDDVNRKFEKNESNLDSCSLKPNEADNSEHQPVDITFEPKEQTVQQSLPKLCKANCHQDQTKDTNIAVEQDDQKVESNSPSSSEEDNSEVQTKLTSTSLKQNKQNIEANDSNSSEGHTKDCNGSSNQNESNVNLESSTCDEINDSKDQMKDSHIGSDQNEKNVNSEPSRCDKIYSENQIGVSSCFKQIESDVKLPTALNSSKSDEATSNGEYTEDTNEQDQQDTQKDLLCLDKCSFEILSNTVEENPVICPSIRDESEIGGSCGQEQISDMEPATQFSSVPYSLSDIQLPESPGNLPVSVTKSPSANANISNSHSFEKCDSDEKLSKQNVQSNGVPASEVSASSDSKNLISEGNSEADTEIKMSNSEPVTGVKESEDKLSACKDKKLRGDIKSDSEEEIEPKSSDTGVSESHLDENEKGECAVNNPQTEHNQDDSKEELVKSTSIGQSEESENEKSSDSDEYQHRKMKSKNDLSEGKSKRNRSRNVRSDNHTSHSSESSSEQDTSQNISDNKPQKSSANEADSDNIPIEKSIDAKLLDRENVKEKSSELNIVPPRQKPKIKRDNVKPEIISKLNAESSNQNHAVKDDHSATNVSISSATVEPKKSEPGEVLEPVPKLPYVPRKICLSNRKLSRKSSEETKNDEPKTKKSKWSSFATIQKTSQTISISTDSLKNWFPDFKLISDPVPINEVGSDEPSSSVKEEKTSLMVPTDAFEMEDTDIKHSGSLKKDLTESELRPSSVENSPEEGPTSKIIFIQNLVRPFTLQQLKALLKQSGNIVEENFWIDKIKSKCFVMYETEEASAKARSTLNGARWPSSNPKILSVEFSSEEELEFHKRGNEPPKPIPDLPVENREPYDVRTVLPVDEQRKKERDRRKEKEKPKVQPPVREWDKDKISQDSPEKENLIKDTDKIKSSEKKEKKDSKRRTNEDTPAKLLDDLFQKTKASPCIYWLPLTEEQVKQREEAKRIRRLEREKRNQQLKEQEETDRRNKRARSGHRGRETENRRSSTRSRSPISRRR